MERNTMFRMASNTKPPVATAIAMLVEDGRLAYEDLVREHMPPWDNYRAGFINIGHLLSHASGLRIPTLFLQPYMEPSAEHPDARRSSWRPPVSAPSGGGDPGHHLQLQQPGYNTLGALVEIASGTPSTSTWTRSCTRRWACATATPRSLGEDGREAGPDVGRILRARR